MNEGERHELGIKVATAGSGTITTRINLPGEIVLNADRLAHIVPRAPGIVRQVLKSVGDAVTTGEVMAWLESSELGEAKVDYLAKWTELGCCTLDLARAQAIHDNTVRLLEVLKSSPSLETLRDMNGSEMGENRSVLVSAYAEFVFAEAAYLREKPLFEKRVASERDYQATQAEYQKADAAYAATRDSVAFKIQRDLLEAKQAQRVREIELEGARRRLYVLGLTSEEVAALELLGQTQTGTNKETHKCNDPNCKGCGQNVSAGQGDTLAALRETEEKLAWYPLRAPFDGTVIDKHLTLGEKHGDDSNAFTIADLSSVWVDIRVYQTDIASVKEGQWVRVAAGDGMVEARGVISYVSPIVDEKTRTALARVVLPNVDGSWRPGLFVTAEVSAGEDSARILIPKTAVQRLDEESIVFLDTDDGLRATPVRLGRGQDTHVEVLSGISTGQRYVTRGAFELKAKLVTSDLDPHAGHGH
ncbi:MAG: efflux RND transporter periplasmic adaptor subunit [Phycisphaerales bacterium]|nr:MAG: efflux RND transporter periplasmic adaptor subunit [Phycisphaerales bacterium]